MPAATVLGEPRRTVMPLSLPARRKRLWATLETSDERRELALRQRLEVQQAVAAVLAAAPAPTLAAPALAAPEAAAEADAAADAEANAMLPDQDGEDSVALALADAADAAAEAAELAAADTEVESDTETPWLSTAFTSSNAAAAGHWTEASESATLGSSDDGPASDNESLGTLPAGLTEPDPPTDSASEAETESVAPGSAAPPTTPTNPRPHFILIIRPAAPRPVVVVPAPLVRYTSILPLSPVLPTRQYDTTPIVIEDDDDGADADDEEEADDSSEALHGSDTDADPDADSQMSQ